MQLVDPASEASIFAEFRMLLMIEGGDDFEPRIRAGQRDSAVPCGRRHREWRWK